MPELCNHPKQGIKSVCPLCDNYFADNGDDIDKRLEEFAKNLQDSQEDVPPEFKRFLSDNWEKLLAYNWISVEERLPHDFHEVLYFAINDKGSKEIMTGHRENGTWTHCCLFYSTTYLNSDYVKVTHWMELPEYPNAEK